ncbi:MAG: GxxExxY protein [Polaribacter sp.]|jgi:GxxExxY protein
MKIISKKYVDKLTYQIIGAAIEVHKSLGPGLLEKIYEVCLIKELNLRGLKTTSQKCIPICYKGEVLDADIRYDILVEDCIVVELKAVLKMNSYFEVQALSYAKLLKIPKAILINFACENIVNEGQKTFVTEIYRRLPRSA